ncbi:MAG: hypothetical protein WCC87_10395 [Candidatus Korobacteraceae bacterium]
MPETTPISAEQLKRLQTLYSQFAAAAGDPRVRSREERLMWVSFLIGHQVASFSDLTGEEAATAIARLQKDIPARKRRPRQPMDRERAERHGKDGRYDGEQFRNAPKLAEAYDLEQIEGYYHRLGWSRDTFDAWLRSPRSPLGRRARPQIRTVAEANRVRWALKRILQKKGLWEEARPA